MRLWCFFSHCLAIVGTSAFLLAVHRLCGVIEGRLSHFLPRYFRTGWQSVISQGKIPWNTPPWPGSEPGPRGGQTVSYPTELPWPGPQGGQTVSYPTEVSWPGPQGGQTVSYPTELSWPWPQGGQTVSYPTELSWPWPRRGQTVRYICSPTELWWLPIVIFRTKYPAKTCCLN